MGKLGAFRRLTAGQGREDDPGMIDYIGKRVRNPEDGTEGTVTAQGRDHLRGEWIKLDTGDEIAEYDRTSRPIDGRIEIIETPDA